MPLLASWRYGNGQVLAFTSEANGDWTPEWRALDGYSAFWAQAVRALLPGNPSPHLQLSTTRIGDEIEVYLDRLNAETGEAPVVEVECLCAEQGAEDPRRLDLTEGAQGSFRGRFVANAPRDYRIVATHASEQVAAIEHIAYPAVYDRTRDAQEILAIAAATGGRVIGPEESVFEGGDPTLAFEPTWRGWLLAALALFILDLLVRYGPNLVWLRPGRSVRRAGRETALAGGPR